MDFILIGKITQITPLPYGVSISVRETKIGIKTKNGHEVGTYDYRWICIGQSKPLENYINNFFKIGATVKINGQIEQAPNADDASQKIRDMRLLIKSIELWNMGDPRKRAIRERYNAKVIGDEKPTTPNFDNDF